MRGRDRLVIPLPAAFYYSPTQTSKGGTASFPPVAAYCYCLPAYIGGRDSLPTLSCCLQLLLLLPCAPHHPLYPQGLLLRQPADSKADDGPPSSTTAMHALLTAHPAPSPIRGPACDSCVESCRTHMTHQSACPLHCKWTSSSHSQLPCPGPGLCLHGRGGGGRQFSTGEVACLSHYTATLRRGVLRPSSMDCSRYVV